MSQIKVTVNGKPFDVDATDGVATMAYARIVEMAGNRGNPTVIGHSRVPAWPTGTPQAFSLTPGADCYVLDGARFEVAHTGNA